MLKVYLERENKNVIIKASGVEEMLKKLNINPTTIIVTKNNELVTEKESLKLGDKIRIIPVISGG